MHRFFVEPDFSQKTTFTLPEKESHHAANVLRLTVNEVVTVLNGRGEELRCAVTGVSKKAVSLQVMERKQHPPRPFQVTLLQAVPKAKLIEAILQKATELGVARVVPLLSERVITQLDEEDMTDKQEKWQHVVIEACKQCGQPWLPQVEKPQTLREFLRRGEKWDLSLVASLQPETKHARAVFQQADFTKTARPAVSLWVGPEGDFTAAEVIAIIAAGAKPITLGPLVLRCETAATYGMSVINHELSAR